MATEEISNLITEKLPQLKDSFSNEQNDTECTLSTIKVFTEYTYQLLKSGNWYALKNCFKLASLIYHRGNETVKHAIENIFMFKISSNMEDNANKDELWSMLPPALKSISLKQASVLYV